MLSSRNRIEDHEVVTEDTRTDELIADMGTKALPENPFVRYRDIMNGYSLVKGCVSRQADERVRIRRGEQSVIGRWYKQVS